MTITLRLSPIDAWFFRDGRPYNHGEANQADVVSLFPPSAPTVVGAIRAGLARANGWENGVNWPRELDEVLGTGFDDLGKLQFEGPFLNAPARCGDNRLQCLFPMPLNLLGNTERVSGDSRWQPKALLIPGKKIMCDLGEVHLPIPDRKTDRGAKEPSDQWVTTDGLQSVLNGELPDARQVVSADELWSIERRIGLKRGETTRTVGEGDLYSPRFVRLHRNVSLVSRISGVPDHMHLPSSLLPFGGENRLADCSRGVELSLPHPPEISANTAGKTHFVVTLLTPLMLPVNCQEDVRHPGPGEPFPGLDRSCIVSACVGKAHSIGGWDSRERMPLPLRPVLPAGSTWFCECDAEAWPEVRQWHGKHVGDRPSFGYGQIVLGKWPPNL